MAMRFDLKNHQNESFNRPRSIAVFVQMNGWLTQEPLVLASGAKQSGACYFLFSCSNRFQIRTNKGVKWILKQSSFFSITLVQISSRPLVFHHKNTPILRKL